jgi:hypothetical protein
LLRDHLDDKDLAQVLLGLAYAQGFDKSALLRTVLDKSPHREVKGVACYALAQALRQSAFPGSKEKEITELFERIEKEFADVNLNPNAQDPRWSLGRLAKSELFEIRYLSIGKEAPDIEGEDIDGGKIKLSDYRGKVVVIDFWGDW